MAAASAIALRRGRTSSVASGVRRYRRAALVSPTSRARRAASRFASGWSGFPARMSSTICLARASKRSRATCASPSFGGDVSGVDRQGFGEQRLGVGHLVGREEQFAPAHAHGGLVRRCVRRGSEQGVRQLDVAQGPSGFGAQRGGRIRQVVTKAIAGASAVVDLELAHSASGSALIETASDRANRHRLRLTARNPPGTA